jgi:hypothetical protein
MSNLQLYDSLMMVATARAVVKRAGVFRCLRPRLQHLLPDQPPDPFDLLVR